MKVLQLGKIKTYKIISLESSIHNFWLELNIWSQVFLEVKWTKQRKTGNKFTEVGKETTIGYAWVVSLSCHTHFASGDDQIPTIASLGMETVFFGGRTSKNTPHPHWCGQIRTLWQVLYDVRDTEDCSKIYVGSCLEFLCMPIESRH